MPFESENAHKHVSCRLGKLTALRHTPSWVEEKGKGSDGREKEGIGREGSDGSRGEGMTLS